MHNKTLNELARGLREKQFSSRELTQHFLDRIERFDGRINSLVTRCDEQALAAADAADRQLAAGEGGALTGIPMAHKDIFCTSGFKTSCG